MDRGYLFVGRKVTQEEARQIMFLAIRSHEELKAEVLGNESVDEHLLSLYDSTDSVYFCYKDGNHNFWGGIRLRYLGHGHSNLAIAEPSITKGELDCHINSLGVLSGVVLGDDIQFYEVWGEHSFPA